MAIELVPQSLQNITQFTDENCWKVTALPAQLDLVPRQGFLPCGWVSIRGRLRRIGEDYSAKLIAEVGGGKEMHIFPLPISFKGTLSELILLPKGVTRLVLEPMNSCGEFQIGKIYLKPVGPAERIRKMLKRIVPLFFRLPRMRRIKAGLRFYTPLLDLSEAYRIAGKFRSYSSTLSYLHWIEEFDTLTPNERRAIQRDSKHWRKSPHFHVIVDTHFVESDLNATIESLNKQLYRNFRVTVAVASKSDSTDKILHVSQWVNVVELGAEGSIIDLALSGLTNGDAYSWIIFMQAGTRLAEHALYWIASEAVKDANAGLIYSDHDVLDSEHCRHDPVFKPDWSPELLRSTNYIGRSAALRSDVLIKAYCPPSSIIQTPDFHDILLRCSEKLSSDAIRHIPAVLWHEHGEENNERESAAQQAIDPVAEHLQRLGVQASVQRLSVDRFRVIYDLPAQPPKISIVVPTRDALQHLRACVESVLTLSSYNNFELIIVDNQSAEPETLEYFAGLVRESRVRVLSYNEPFNYSAINNFAAAAAVGEVLCLLNNDTQVISHGWMEEMLGYLLQQDVGVVGAKLYYSDGRIQHAGDAVGPGGGANHLHALLDRGAPGYCGRALLAQDLSAVTAACLMTWRDLYMKLGGLDEKNLPVSFNDVDYCLRVREAGYRTLWTPYAELYHHESVSRGQDDVPEKVERAQRELAYLRKRWKHLLNHDPFYNPNLNYDYPDFSLSRAPKIQKPWQT